MSSDEETKPKRQRREDVHKDAEPNEGAENMSIDETNKLRAKLGLAPLEVTTDEKAEDGTIMGNDGTAFHHTPAESLTDKNKGEKLRRKIKERRTKRDIETKLKKIKGLGESDSDEGGITSWVKKSRKIEKERKKANKKESAIRAREKEIEEETKIIEEEKRQKLYGKNALAGMSVEHDIENFIEGKDIILTIKDRGILEEEGLDEKDVLVNVNLVDNERAKTYIKNVKDARNTTGYNPMEKFDAENVEDEAYGEKKLLSKYDETLDGKKKKKFMIGGDGNISTTAVEIRKQMRDDMTKNSVSLKSVDLKVQSDYLTQEEAKGFKKRVRKVKKVRKAGIHLMDDLLARRGLDEPMEKKKTREKSERKTDHGSRNWKRGEDNKKEVKDERDDDEITESELQAQLDAAERNMGTKNKVEDSVQKDVVINSSLARTRRLLASKGSQFQADPAASLRSRINKIAEHTKVKEEAEDMNFDEKPDVKPDTLILNDVDEFCRAVGQANAEKIYDREKAHVAQKEIESKKEKQIEIDVEEEFRKIRYQREGHRKKKFEPEESEDIEREPLANRGLAGAIKVAMAKGYIEQNTARGVQIDSKHKDRISAHTYSIEDKNRVDHLDKYAADKYRRDARRDGKGGSGMDFPELNDYKPNIQIEYVDEIGRPKTEKEAFRDLSHRFHGKGSGKMKQEKRQKRLKEESALQQMSSTDTPLNTVQMLRRKQQETSSPYISLTGGAMLSAGNQLSKH